MLGALPKLLGRGFVLGFLLPSILFCAYLQAIESHGSMLPGMQSLDSLTQATPIVLAVLVLAVVLVALNRAIVRILEGYGAYNPIVVLKKLELRHFKDKIAPLYSEQNRLDKARENNPNERPAIADFPRKLERAVKSFPDHEDHVLPTQFGNTMRAFEVYPRVVYGMELIALWPRLYSVIPKSARDQVTDSRAMIDFNVNVLLLSCFCLVVALFDDIKGRELGTYNAIMLIIPSITALCAWIALPQSAQQWGEIIKSNFDLYRPKLAKQLGLNMPDTLEAERIMRREVSRAVLFRSSYAATLTDSYRAKATPKNS